MVESSLHSGHFQGVGEVQIQVLQQDRLMFGGATDAAFADRYAASRRQHHVNQGDVRQFLEHLPRFVA